MLAVDRPLDMMRTMVNIFSDSIGASIIASSEGENLYQNSFNEQLRYELLNEQFFTSLKEVQ